MASPKKPPKQRPDVAADKASLTSRLDRVFNIRANAKESSIYKAEPQLQEAVVKIDLAGTSLADALAKFTLVEQAYIIARETLSSRLSEFDCEYDVYAALVTKFAHTLDELASLGMVAQTRVSHPLQAPTTVAAKVDPKTGKVRLSVKGAQESGACLVEITTDKDNEASWKRLTGTGIKHVLEGYPPGTYWVRAANSRSGKQSTWSQPVPFVIK